MKNNRYYYTEKEQLIGQVFHCILQEFGVAIPLHHALPQKV